MLQSSVITIVEVCFKSCRYSSFLLSIRKMSLCNILFVNIISESPDAFNGYKVTLLIFLYLLNKFAFACKMLLLALSLVWYFRRLKMQNNCVINLIFLSVPLLFNLFYMN